jgi:predicted nucleic acid-binding protein
MMNEVIVDANFLVALMDERDVWHPKAVTLLNALRTKEAKAVYLDCVLNEVISVLGRRFEERGRTNEFSAVLKKLKILVPERLITWVWGAPLKVDNKLRNRRMGVQHENKATVHTGF